MTARSVNSRICMFSGTNGLWRRAFSCGGVMKKEAGIPKYILTARGCGGLWTAPCNARRRCDMISLAPPAESRICQAPGVRDESMGSVMVGLRRHGDDRQSSVRLDVV